MSKTPPKEIKYQTTCKSGCGVLTLTLDSDDVSDLHRNKDIRCKSCGKINVAEVINP